MKHNKITTEIFRILEDFDNAIEFSKIGKEWLNNFADVKNIKIQNFDLIKEEYY